MQKWAKWNSPAEPEIFDGGQEFPDANGTRHPKNVITLGADAQLRAIGLMKLIPSTVAPGGIVTERSYAEVNGETVAQLTTEPAHPPPPDPKAELEAVIAAVTTLAELKAALLGLSRVGRVAGRPT